MNRGRDDDPNERGAGVSPGDPPVRSHAGSRDRGGILPGPLALLSDAVHVQLDLLSLLLSYGAIRMASLPPTDTRTFGWHRQGLGDNPLRGGGGSAPPVAPVEPLFPHPHSLGPRRYFSSPCLAAWRGAGSDPGNVAEVVLHRAVTLQPECGPECRLPTAPALRHEADKPAASHEVK